MEICALTSMGFSRNDAEKALRRKGGNVEQAIDYLLSSEQEQQQDTHQDDESSKSNEPSPSQPSLNTTATANNLIEEQHTMKKYELICSTLSQYDLTNGKSAFEHSKNEFRN